MLTAAPQPRECWGLVGSSGAEEYDVLQFQRKTTLPTAQYSQQRLRIYADWDLR
ncbi:MAG: hypothetical protein MI924_06735 [Chloroflexales bacterium]|nr:hypothetical protein [Chloroflexales bacterium]